MIFRNKHLFWSAGILGVFFYLSNYFFPVSQIFRTRDPLVVTDVSRLQSAKFTRIVTPTTVEELQQALADARKQGLKVSISGSKHSQGGQTLFDNAIQLDMRSFNKVLSLDEKTKIIRVQSGARWKDIQEYINPHGLAVKVMQSSYIFTIGGSMSANAHGRDLDKTSLVETVRSFHLLTADGRVRNVSRTENPDLFRAVIGGYGLFGVILDADIQLTDDAVYEQASSIIDYREFPAFFKTRIKGDPSVKMMLVRPSFEPDAFLREMVVTTWKATDKTEPDIHRLRGEKHVYRDKYIFSLSRKYDWAKKFRWKVQKKIECGMDEVRLVSRNNAMRPPLAPLELLNYYSYRNTDIIQEYYVPIRNFVPFMDEFRSILQQRRTNVISSTIRYVKGNDEVDLAFAPKEDCFAVIQMTNVGLSPEAQSEMEKTTRMLVDAAIRANGTYYLTYQLYPTKEQFHSAYPKWRKFFELKHRYDPTEMFMSKFYETYGR